MKLLSALIMFQCLIFPLVSKADPTSALIKAYASSRNLTIIDAVREFIHQNSDHGDGAWNKKYGGNNAFVLDHLYRTAVGDPKAQRPELLCGNRSAAMQALLGNLGIRSRTIYLLSNYAGPLYGHVFVEVMNTTTGAWEVQDADYNVAYESPDGRRLGISDLIATPEFSQIIPVNAINRGWGKVGVTPLMIGQFFNVAYSPGERMLYFNQQALDTGVVSKAEAYIKHSYGKADYTPALVGDYLVRPLVLPDGDI